MKKFLLPGLVAVSLAASLSHARTSPLSIKYSGDALDEQGAAYQTYTVKCSDKREYILSKLDEPTLWCVGNPAEGNCSRKKVRVASDACNQR